MGIRNYTLQSFHDSVIDVAASYLAQWTVYKNPGQQKNASIGNSYPDLILVNRTTNYIEYIIEVETSDTITAHEAANQWKIYSNLPGTFYLLVPSESRSQAEFLCRQYGIQAKFGTYWRDSFNRIQINYE